MEWIDPFTFFSLFNKESAPKKKDTEADVLEQVVVEKDLKASSDVATVTLEKKESKVNSLLKKIRLGGKLSLRGLDCNVLSRQLISGQIDERSFGAIVEQPLGNC